MRPTVRSVRFTALFALTALASASLAACGSGSGGDPDTVKVSFKQSTDNSIKVMDTYLADIKKQFEKANPGKKVELVPIKAPDSEYYTKLQQMLRSPKTAPDLVYEDTFLINSDITSGYLKPLDDYLAKWKDWDRFIDTAKAAARGEDGKTYGVPDGTDTRGLWFSKDVFAKAGLPADWQPRTWDEVLDAARTIKEKVPGVTPINVYTGKPAGEAATMQGFQMLLYGTGDGGSDPLYDKDSKKWIKAGQGFEDSLAFVETVYKEKLGPEVSDALDPNFGTKVRGELLPQGKLGIALDGSLAAAGLAGGQRARVARVVEGAGTGRHAHAARAGARQGEHVRRLDLGDPGQGRQPGPGLRVHQDDADQGQRPEVVRRQLRHRGPRGRGERSRVRRGAARHRVLHRPRRGHPLPARLPGVPEGVRRRPGRPWRASRPAT